MKWFNKICSAVSLVCYLFCLYAACRLCQYGGNVRHLLPWLAGGGLVFCLSFTGWLISILRIRRGEAIRSKRAAWFRCCFVIAFLATAYFGSQIVYSAIPYHGALSRLIDNWWRQTYVVLKHDNLFEDGADGFLRDLDQAISLPSELHTKNTLRISFDEEGNIQTIYAFLYGEKGKGQIRSYLIKYDRAGSEKMSVWLGDNDYDIYDGERLEPLFTILQNARIEDRIAQWRETFGEGVYTLEYAGIRTFETEKNLQYLPGDVDGDGVLSGISDLTALRSGGCVAGFTVSLSAQNESECASLHFIMEPSYISGQELMLAAEKQQIEAAKDADSWTTSRTNESMYFFFDEQIGWRLVVTDAALGSRFYELEKTDDGGSSWEKINTNPFDGSTGVAEGLIFYDKDFGFTGLASASQSYSKLYVTRDGGLSFEKVILPLDTAMELPELGQSLGFTSADYDYYEMPEQDGSSLFILAITEKGENSGLLFKSEDQGVTWTFCTE